MNGICPKITHSLCLYPPGFINSVACKPEHHSKMALDFIQTKDVIIYMLDLGSKSVAPWKLAMRTALDALLVCRLDHNFNEYNIVEFLLTNGIPFHTLCHVSCRETSGDGDWTLASTYVLRLRRASCPELAEGSQTTAE